MAAQGNIVLNLFDLFGRSDRDIVNHARYAWN